MYFPFSVVSPTLKYGDEVIQRNTIRIPSAPKTVSCELYNAGPPLPGVMELLITGEDNRNTTNSEKDDATCTWNYPQPLQFYVIDLTETVSRLQLLFNLNHLHVVVLLCPKINLTRIITLQFCGNFSDLFSQNIRLLLY